MPVYNTEEYVKGAIESVLQQEGTEVHLCLIDDKSTDSSLDILKSYKDRTNVTVLENSENRGCYYSRNRGLEWAKDNIEFDFFTIHDSDDVSSTDRFKVLVDYFTSDRLLGMKTTFVRVNKDLSYHFNSIGEADVYSSEGIAIYRREVFTDYLGYFDSVKYSADTDYWERLKAFCEVNQKFAVDISYDIAYFARLRGDNLTKIYPIESRWDYYNKIKNDIVEMKNKNNFYRSFKS